MLPFILLLRQPTTSPASPGREHRIASSPTSGDPHLRKGLSWTRVPRGRGETRQLWLPGLTPLPCHRLQISALPTCPVPIEPRGSGSLCSASAPSERRCPGPFASWAPSGLPLRAAASPPPTLPRGHSALPSAWATVLSGPGKLMSFLIPWC